MRVLGRLRLFGDPIRAIECDLTATTVVVANHATKLVRIAVDFCSVSSPGHSELHDSIAPALALGIPVSHVCFQSESQSQFASASDRHGRRSCRKMSSYPRGTRRIRARARGLGCGSPSTNPSRDTGTGGA